MLLIASYIFYGAWDWRFLSLIVLSTLLDYYCGLKIDSSEGHQRRKLFLMLSIIGNLGMLGFFKYFNFFTSNLMQLLSWFQIHPDIRFFSIVLPVGISFYTFQTMSYTIDIYKRELKPTHDLLDFALFVSFFPQLVAGPIERAKNLLPQVLAKRTITLDSFYQGFYLIFWGLFQKVVIADNLSIVVDSVFNTASPYNGINVLIALYAFSFQIFCDFAGYSNIARGLSKVMGFELMVNFNLPYFSTNPSEFWKRWHISLSSWLRDYLYIPLGGNKGSSLKTYRNLSLTMLLGGLWHGAAWTFIIWGAYQGLLLIVHRLCNPLFSKIKTASHPIIFFLQVSVFFQFICLGWLFFRARSITQIYAMLQALFTRFTFDGFSPDLFIKSFPYIAIIIFVQIFQFKKNDLFFIYNLDWRLRTAAYFIMYCLFLIFGVTNAESFIYFQF